MKDRNQKQAALRYAVARRWLPQVELDVGTLVTTNKSPAFITDVDVFASAPDDLTTFHSVVIDCKTKKGESPISRALWQRGLIARLKADSGICILRAPRIETDHRFTAAQLGITLLTEAEFETFATATAADYRAPLGAVAQMECWDEYFAIGRRFPRLQPVIEFSKSGFWMSKDEAEGCVRAVFLVASLRGEFDPDLREHQALVADIAALFLHALSRISVTIFSTHLHPAAKAELSSGLLLLLYGGRNAYDHLNRIRRIVIGASDANLAVPGESVAPAGDASGPQRGVASSRSLSLPDWDRFVDLIRQLLEAPLTINRAPLMLRELSFGILAGETTGVSNFARQLASESAQGARAAVLGVDYFCRATGLPREFNEKLTARLLDAQSVRDK